MKGGDYKKWSAWHKAMDLVVAIYGLTDLLPKEEMFGLTSQMRRAAVSIPSNIAEGSRRTGKEVKHFLTIAFGSGAELETQIEIVRRLDKTRKIDVTLAQSLLNEVMKLLNVMIHK